MGKIAFLMSGQGAQYPGMGKALCEKSPAAKAVFELADKLRPGTSRQCFEGTQEELTVTKNTQPCVWCVDLAAAEALKEAGIAPDAAAGFSLGEIAALALSGAASREDAFQTVCRRAELMEAAAEAHPGAMAAVLKLTGEAVEALCAELDGAWAVNYNCPGQVAVACEADKLDALLAAVKAAGGRAVPIKVSGGFHSPLMAEAAQGLQAVLGGTALKAPELPLYSNVTAQPYPADKAEMADLLSKQVCNPVRWQKTLENLWAEGFTAFIECGPGKTLQGLVKKTLPDALACRVEDEETLLEAIEAVKEWRNRA